MELRNTQVSLKGRVQGNSGGKLRVTRAGRGIRLERSNSVAGTPSDLLIDLRRRLQINLFPLAFNNPGANLGGRLALLVLLVGVIKLA